MALGDTDDLACSQHGRQNPVVLYCHTCQLLLCPRCVSHGPAGEEPPHRDHTYLEIRDAHDMLKVSFFLFSSFGIWSNFNKLKTQASGCGRAGSAECVTQVSRC